MQVIRTVLMALGIQGPIHYLSKEQPMHARALKAALLAVLIVAAFAALPAAAITVAPNTHVDISNTDALADVYFLYNFQYDGGGSFTSVGWLSDLIAAGTSSIDFYASREAPGSAGSGVYAIIGLCEPGAQGLVVAGGEGNKVGISLDTAVADPAIDTKAKWDEVFVYGGSPNPFKESDIAKALRDGDTALLTQFTGQFWNTFATMDEVGRLVDFSFAKDGGTAYASNPVPEPSSMLALGMGLVGLVGFARRRRK
jgi:hypothetical protein